MNASDGYMQSVEYAVCRQASPGLCAVSRHEQ